MDNRSVNDYADMADRYGDTHLRDVQAAEERKERARSKKGYTQSDGVQPLTLGWAMYKRFNPNAEYVTVTTLQGREVEITRTQADVLDLARTFIDTGTTTMRAMAETLGVAASTIYRALVRLAAFGLIGYITTRGRYGGTLLFRRGRNDGLDRFQKVAKAKIRKWQLATEARFSRLRGSVASMFSMKEYQDHGLLHHYVVTKGATVNTWTPEELRDAGII